MSSGFVHTSAISAARTAKLGLSLAGFTAGMGGTGLRSRLTRDAAGDALRIFARAGVGLFDGSEDAESLLDGVGDAHFTLRLKPEALGPDQIEGRLNMARERLRPSIAFDVLLDGGRLLAPDGDALWAAVLAASGTGVCGAVGIAVEPGGDALGLARRFKPKLIQVCAGLLDQRLILSGALGEIAALGAEVHVRTSLLHGLLFMPREGLPPALAEAGPQVSRVRRLIAEAGADPLQAALAFALDRPEASHVIVEASSAGEVRALLAAAAAPAPALDWPALALDHPAALDAEARLGRRAA
jgi:D-threo-aldose 1-dehydrogenase